MNAPVAESQADAMEWAYDGIDRSPVDVDYVEVHGTGKCMRLFSKMDHVIIEL